MITLGIETSCDETAVGILKGNRLLANIVSSQVAHTKYGGVVPELAARNHIKGILPLTKLTLEVAHLGLADIDLISVTRGPGLVGALLVGLAFAKSLALSSGKPIIGVNHLEGHVYSLRLVKKMIHYPYLVLLVSGGHTELILVMREFEYQTVGKTVDDACGEAFDKVAKLMKLPYPGGPYIEKTAASGVAGAVKLPIPRLKGFDFSYAGLKTAVLYYIRDNPDYSQADVAFGFQEAALEQLVSVTRRALEMLKVKYFGVVGGVSANKRLQQKMSLLAKESKADLYIPELQFCADNGAMIALAGARRYKRFGPSDLNIDAIAREDLEEIQQ